MEVIECKSGEEISYTFEVMHQLRPHLIEQEYLPLIREIESQGGRLIAAVDEGTVVGCSLFRQEMRRCS